MAEQQLKLADGAKAFPCAPAGRGSLHGAIFVGKRSRDLAGGDVHGSKAYSLNVPDPGQPAPGWGTGRPSRERPHSTGGVSDRGSPLAQIGS